MQGGAAKLLHMVFTVAKDPALGPCVIYCDEVEKLLAGGKKKVVTEGPARFKKDLPVYIASLTAEHSAVVIGCSAEPWEADAKAMAQCFDKQIYVPCPDYATRLRLWRSEIMRGLSGLPEVPSASAVTASALTTFLPADPVPGSRAAPMAATSTGGRGGLGASGGTRLPASSTISAAGGSGAPEDDLGLPTGDLLAALPLYPASAAVSSETPSGILERFNYSAIAQVSNGYTAGSIREAVRATLNARRLERISVRPILESEFLGALGRCPRVYADENERFREFSDKSSGYEERRTVPVPEDPKAKKGK